jgi:hypothetical protein
MKALMKTKASGWLWVLALVLWAIAATVVGGCVTEIPCTTSADCPPNGECDLSHHFCVTRADGGGGGGGGALAPDGGAGGAGGGAEGSSDAGGEGDGSDGGAACSTSSNCDDHDACTHGDHCDQEGRCVGTSVSCISEPGPCGVVRSCNGGASCTETFPFGNGCDDGQACTYDDTCDGKGGCAGKTITCESAEAPCGVVRSCNGTVSCAESYPSGTNCDDKQACTYDDKCDGKGGCGGTVLSCVNGPAPCGVVRACNGSASCTESYPSGTDCGDGDLCTFGDHCNGSGACVGTAVSCVSGPVPCGVIRTCNGSASCTESYPSGSDCGDGDLCTFGDHCNGSGACVGSAVSCVNGAAPCGIIRACNGSASCTESYPSGTTCDDGQACTFSDHCDGSGGCIGSAISCVSDSAPCGMVRSCNGTSSCTATYSTAGCNDGNLCTTGDHCSNGVCAGAPVQCTGTCESCRCVGLSVPTCQCSGQVAEVCRSGVCTCPAAGCLDC